MVMSGLAMPVSWMSTHSFNRWALACSVTPSTVSVLRVPPRKKMPSKFGDDESCTFRNRPRSLLVFFTLLTQPSHCCFLHTSQITTVAVVFFVLLHHTSYCCVFHASESHQLLLCLSFFWIPPVTVVFFALLNHTSYCCVFHASESHQLLLCFSRFSRFWITPVTVVFFTLLNHTSHCCVFHTSESHQWLLCFSFF